MSTKTFQQLYEQEKVKPTPAQTFIKKVAKMTERSENTVRMWLVGRQIPDKLAQSIIAKEFDCDPETLFPQEMQEV